MLSLTLLSHNDNYILFSTLYYLLKGTNWDIYSEKDKKADDIGVKIHILLQNCSKSYINSLEMMKKRFTEEIEGVFINLHIYKENLGLSKANNVLFSLTKDSKYVLHIEDDWIMIGKNKDWLKISFEFLEKKGDVSTISFRKYLSEDEEERYGWRNNIHYKCHKYSDNFNYVSKLGGEEKYKNCNFIEIKNFLFTFNPVIRRNKDYITKEVYPLPEFDDIDNDKNIEYHSNIKNHLTEKWGFCEALSMEKIRDLITYRFNDGIFVHYDDWSKELNDKIPIYTSYLQYIFNINCHFPVLVILLDKYPEFRLKHGFMFPIIIDMDNMYDKGNISKILANYSPRCILSFGDLNLEKNKYLSKIFTFEYRKKWIHYSHLSQFKIPHIETCFFSSFKHQEDLNHPLVTVITPTYESNKRIFRPYQSLLSQTYTNWEWIIFDDSKSDTTWKILEEFADSDHRIKIFRREKNYGSIGSNKKICSNLGSGKLIFELDHDDDILPHALERVIAAYKKYPQCGLFYSDFIECYEDSFEPFNYGEHFGYGFGSYYRKWWRGKWQYVCNTPRINPHTIRHIIGVPNHFRCWTRDAYISLGGHNSQFPVADDYELIIRTFLKYKWCHIPEMLYIQYRNDGGDNFTFHRNGMIQYLVGETRWKNEEDIHLRLESLGIVDDKYNCQKLGGPKDFENWIWKYHPIEFVFRSEDTLDNPLITIIIPTHNRPKHLQKALDSIFSQTYQNFEILLVGDNCPTLESFLEEYSNAKDHRLRWYNLESNHGPGGAVPRNYALKCMNNTGWIAYLDDDNIWKENHLEIAVNETRKNKDIKYVVNSMIIDDKPLIFNELRKGRIDTSAVIHRFELCFIKGVWKDRVEAGYAHDFEFFERILKNELGVWTEIPTLFYNTEFNGQTYEQLIGM